MITFASLVIGATSWILPAALLAIVAAIIVLAAYRRVTSQRWLAFCAAGLKTLGLLALAACLIEPLYSGVRARPGANLFAIAVDNSRSMTAAGRDEFLQELLAETDDGWQTRLSQDFEVRRYRFDAALQTTADFEEIPFDGNATQLRGAVSTMAERFESRPLAGMLLFSDGNLTDLQAKLPADEKLPPVYPVVWTDDAELLDLGIESVAVSQSPFEDAPVSAKADVALLGDVGDEVTAEILDPQGQRIAQQTLPVEAGAESLTFRLQFPAPHRGVEFYRIRVAAEGDFEQFDAPDSSGEATLANNERALTIDRGSRAQRVLYVSGRPNWEFKFLRRALEEDEAVQLTGLIRIAKREPKFKWRDGKVDSSNPLFRGFDDVDEEQKEQYDQPVFVRIDTQDQSELRDGFPQTAEKLFEFDAIILDDVEAEFFSRDQLALFNDFVSRRGGSLLMLGGQESFRQGGFDRSPLQDLLPVYLNRDDDATPAGRLRLSLTRDGWLQPWVRLRRTEEDEQARLRDMPEFRTLNPLSGVKPGATVLANVSDGRGQVFRALVAQQFGRGKTAALAVGDFWRWALRRENHEQDDQGRAVRQMLRWLIADVPGPVEVALKSDDQHIVRIEVRARDENYQPLDNATVKTTITPVGSEPLTLDAEPSLAEPGLFVTEYVPREPGAYRVAAAVTDGAGKNVGAAVAGWVYQPDVDEFRRLAWNRRELKAIADASGGRLIEASDLDQFVRELPEEDAPVTERYTYPLWHRSSVFLFALCCFIGEWGLRRFRGLP